MVTRKARILVLIFVLADVLTTCGAWLLAYYARFYSEPFLTLLPASKGVPALARYALLIPLIAVLWPIVLYFHGLYRFRRGRSRIDELFAILLSVVIASALALSATLYIRVYHRYQPDVAPLWEFSQGVFAIFIALDVLSISAGRAAIRSYLKKRWSAGHNAERILIAGAGELGQTVAEALIAHKDLGYQVVGFLDDSPSTLPAGAPPLLGSLQDVLNVIQAQRVDQLYLALPLESHAEMLKLIKALRNECLDVRVVPDLLQYAAIKATIEDLDGIPIISLNELPLSGFSSMAKRVMDIILSASLLILLTFIFPILPLIALLIRFRGGRGPIVYRQDRMSLDGKVFQLFKFRSMVHEAEKETGPIWASEEDPRRTAVGTWLRKYNLDELPQLLNVFLGDMSLVGPRPERPPFVQKFKEHIPQYMLRHRVRSGITGWAQVNGLRGNTSLEKRIEFDLYYIENWSLMLDFKILILTLFRGFGQKHAY